MTKHLTKTETHRFRARALPDADLRSMSLHLAQCDQCHQQFSQAMHSAVSHNVGFTLSPQFWFRHDHLDFEQLVGLADKTIEQSQKEILDIHMQACETCREDLSSLLAFREKTSREIDVSYASIRTPGRTTLENLWQRLWPNPAYALGVAVIVLIVIVTAAILVKRRSEPLEANKTKSNQITVDPTPAPTASAPVSDESPSLPETKSLVATLRDGSREITFDGSGRVSGLDDLPEVTQREVANALVAERIERPAVLNEIVGPGGNLRGTGNSKTFKLLSPDRRVITDDHPTFKWEKLDGATKYRVYVGDSSGREIAQSDELTPDQTTWRVSKALSRNQVYSWNVVATVDGKEVVSPDPSSPEMKFRILSFTELQKIDHLKKSGSHLALGVAYAKTGLLTEAEKEFQTLIQMNPDSQIARKLLYSVRTMRNSNTK